MKVNLSAMSDEQIRCHLVLLNERNSQSIRSRALREIIIDCFNNSSQQTDIGHRTQSVLDTVTQAHLGIVIQQQSDDAPMVVSHSDINQIIVDLQIRVRTQVEQRCDHSLMPQLDREVE